MTSDPDHVRDEEIVTVGGEGPADTAGPRDRVVGYGAFLFTEAPGRRGGDR